MFRTGTILVFAILVLAGCRNDLQDRAKVQEAIVHRLETSSGLDLKTLNVTTTAVTFDKNLAYATVAFHPKDDPTVSNGMTMKYTLENRDGKWVVVNVGDSQGHGLPGHGTAASPGGDQLPAGHPSVDGAAPAGSMPNPHASSPDRGAPGGQAR